MSEDAFSEMGLIALPIKLKDPFLSFYQIQNGARAVFLGVHNLYPDSLSRGAACSTFVPTNNAPCSQIQ